MANKVRLTVNERKTVVDGLIENAECCWEESDREVLNSLSDVTLAKMYKQQELLVNAEATGGGASELGASADQLGEDSDDDVAVEEEPTKEGESQADGKDKPTGDLDPGYKTNALSERDRRDLAFARKYRMAQRQRHVQAITDNENNKFTVRQLAAMEDDVLANMASLAMRREEPMEVYMPSFFGSQGAAVTNMGQDQAEEPLVLGQIDYKELAAGNGRG